MNLTRDPYHTTLFGAMLDEEINKALRADLPLELIHAELAARTRGVAEQIAAHRARPPVRVAVGGIGGGDQVEFIP